MGDPNNEVDFFTFLDVLRRLMAFNVKKITSLFGSPTVNNCGLTSFGLKINLNLKLGFWPNGKFLEITRLQLDRLWLSTTCSSFQKHVRISLLADITTATDCLKLPDFKMVFGQTLEN